MSDPNEADTRSGPSVGSDAGSGSDRILANTSAVPSAPPAIGDVIANKYRVDEVLGAGGMGVVVGVTHLQLRTRAAIKYLTPFALSRPEIIERFAREARIAAKLRSEHVVRVLDVGTLERGEPYLLMERLEGHDLRAILKERGTLPVDEAIGYVLQACEALTEAHAAGIVHRDLKPSNLFVTTRADGSPLVKIVDFGISKLLPTAADGGEETLTLAAELVGSPLYMSPEQVKSAVDVDARTDIWALGAVLYRLLTGRSAFGAKTSAEIFVAILTHPTPSLCASRPDAPPALDAVIERCLRKDREARFATVNELMSALRGCLALAGSQGPWVPAPPSSARLREAHDPVGSGSASVQGIGRPTDPPPTRRGRGLPIVLSVLLVAVAAGAAAVIVKSRASARPNEPSDKAQAVAAAEPSAPATTEPPPSAANPDPIASAEPSATPTASTVGSARLLRPTRVVPVTTPKPRASGGYDDSAYGGRR